MYVKGLPRDKSALRVKIFTTLVLQILQMRAADKSMGDQPALDCMLKAL
jgi:hypothetical protein